MPETTVAAVDPDPVSVMRPFAVEVLVSPEYVTMIVHVFPVVGVKTVVDEQVPPVIAKVPFPVPLAFAIDGAAEKVNDPVPEFVTVIVLGPFVVVPPPFRTGLGALKASVAPVTVNVTALLAAAAPVTVTVTFLALSVAPAVMVKVAVS